MKDMRKYYLTYEIYINSTCVNRCYSKKSSIELCQKLCSNLFTGHRHGEVVCVETGEVIYSI